MAGVEDPKTGCEGQSGESIGVPFLAATFDVSGQFPPYAAQEEYILG